MMLFAGIFAVFVQLLDTKPKDVPIWDILRDLSYLGIATNSSGVFAAIILVIDADIKATTKVEDIFVRIARIIAFFWMISCPSLGISIPLS
jgi:hypothetical protein